jgi:phosphate acyltransferase
MRIAVDAMGSDRAPTVEVEGAVGALLERPDLTLVLVGDRAAV